MEVYKKKHCLNPNAQVSLYGDRVVIDEMEIPFRDVGVITVLGRNKLNIYYGKEIYQLKGSKRFNALKYVHISCRYKNLVKGDPNAEFLGL